MEVLLAPKAGFCFGVRRAVELAEKTVATAQGPVYTLGPLIHNPSVVQALATRGVKAVSEPAEASAGTILIRSHGAPPGLIAEAEGLGLSVVDATCPFVRRAQRLAESLAADGYQVMVVRDPSHPEIRAVAAAAGEALVVSGVEDLDRAKIRRRVGLICQTTLASETLAAVAGAVAPLCRELAIHNTICPATYERQRGALALAERVDAMVVVGGRQSANTAHLAELSRRVVPTHQIEEASELIAAWFAGCSKVGVTAGASTPAEQINAVRKRLEEIAQESAAKTTF